MQESAPEIMQHVAAYEDMILPALVTACNNPNVTKKICLKGCIYCILWQIF